MNWETDWYTFKVVGSTCLTWTIMISSLVKGFSMLEKDPVTDPILARILVGVGGVALLWIAAMSGFGYHFFLKS